MNWDKWKGCQKDSSKESNLADCHKDEFEPRIYRFIFQDPVPREYANRILITARFCVECLFGKTIDVYTQSLADIHLNAGWMIINGKTVEGEALARIFKGLLEKKCGPKSFRLDRYSASAMKGPLA